MSAPYYVRTALVPRTRATAEQVNNELAKVEAALDQLPAPANIATGAYTHPATGGRPWFASEKLNQLPHVFDFVDRTKHAGILAGTNTDPLHADLQKALDVAQPVVLPRSGTLWIGSRLKVPSSGGFIGDFGCTLKAVANFGNNPLIINSAEGPTSAGARNTGITLVGVKLDGNKANNATATEFSHCLHLNAVDGAKLAVWAVNPKGDGALLSYSRKEDGSYINPAIGCRDVTGFIRSEYAARMGVAITCGEHFDLSVHSLFASLFGFDIEPDNNTSFVRFGRFNVTADQCGQAFATGFCGGVAITGTDSAGTGFADVGNLDVTMQVNGSLEHGFVFRDIHDCTFRGTIRSPAQKGVYGIPGAATGGSRNITWDMSVISAGEHGVDIDGNGDTHHGRLEIYDPVARGASLKDCSGGTLTITVNSAGQEGVYLDNVDDMIFPNMTLLNNVSHNLSIQNTSGGNRFPNLRATGSTAGWGVNEAAGCNNNHATNARITGNASGVATLSGALSFVELEPLIGKAALTFTVPGAVPGFSVSTAPIVVAGAAAGDIVSFSPPAPVTNYFMPEVFVEAANNVRVRYWQYTGAAANVGGTTFTVAVTKRIVA